MVRHQVGADDCGHQVILRVFKDLAMTAPHIVDPAGCVAKRCPMPALI